MNFYGQTENLLDEKGRLVLPKRYRDDLGTDFFAVLDFDGCLSLYPESVYERKAQKIESLDDFNASARAVKRVFFANSFPLSMDKQGRVPLPHLMLEKAGIGKAVALVGVADHLEVWNLETYRQNESKAEDSYSDLAATLFGRGHDQ